MGSGAPTIILGFERSNASLSKGIGEKTEHIVERQIGRWSEGRRMREFYSDTVFS